MTKNTKINSLSGKTEIHGEKDLSNQSGLWEISFGKYIFTCAASQILESGEELLPLDNFEVQASVESVSIFHNHLGQAIYRVCYIKINYFIQLWGLATGNWV